MAIFHLSVKVHTRAKGHSAVGAAAYRAGVNLVDERDGTLHKYAHRQGVVREASALVLPEGAPEWNRAELWNQAEKSEKRKNSCVGREVEVSLPHELPAPARVALARGFTEWLVKKYGFAAECNVHEPTPKKDDARNHHAHIQTSTRRLTAEGFGEKIRVLDAIKTGAPEILAWREEWAGRVNTALALHKIKSRVDHRSNADRGLEELPTVHVGNGPRAYERQDLNREIEAWNVEAEALRGEVTRVHALVAFEEQLAETRKAQEAAKAQEEAQAQERGIEAAKAEAVARAEAAAQQAIRAVIQQRAEAARRAVAKAMEDEAAKARAEAVAKEAEKTAAAAALVNVLEAVKTLKQLAETKAALAAINTESMKIKEQLGRAKPSREVHQALEQASRMNVVIDDAKATVKAVREKFDQLPWWRLMTKRSMSAQIDASQAQLTAWSMEYREVKRTAQAPVRDDLIKRLAELDQEREKLLKQRDELIEKIASEDALDANPKADVKPSWE